MNYQRTMRYQYYQILMCHVEKKQRQHVDLIDGLFDFPKWASAMRDAGKIKKSIDFNNAKARIERIARNNDTGTWGLRIMKLRDTNVPAKAKENEDAAAIKLDDDEYIGEDLFILYDENKGIAMIQQNRMSLGLSRIEEFFQYTYKKYVDSDSKQKVILKPINGSNSIERIFRSNYRCLELSFANIKEYDFANNNSALSDLLAPFRNLYGVSGYVKVGLGRSKEDTLNRQEIQDLTKELSDVSNKRFVRGARVSIKEEDDTDVEIVDLFEEICHDFLTFEIEKREILQYENVIPRMRKKYLSRREELYSLVDPRVKL